jgi:hypothetical protein
MAGVAVLLPPLLLLVLLLLLAVAVNPSGTPTGAGQESPPPCDGEVLYNNICLPRTFPPPDVDLLQAQRDPQPPPYLTDHTARPVNISIGRQLFIDDFLLMDQQSVARRWHQGEMSDDALVRPDRHWEKAAGGLSGTGGLWWDPKLQEFRLFYNCGCGDGYGFCVATSPDGERFSKPSVGQNGTNCIVLHQNKKEVPPFDGGTIVLDLDEPDQTKRYKMAERPHCATSYQHMPACAPVAGQLGLGFANGGYRLHASADGVNWRVLVNRTGIIGDTSTIFRNPPAFRDKWVFSIKAVTTGSTPEQSDTHGELGATMANAYYYAALSVCMIGCCGNSMLVLPVHTKVTGCMLTRQSVSIVQVFWIVTGFTMRQTISLIRRAQAGLRGSHSHTLSLTLSVRPLLLFTLLL